MLESVGVGRRLLLEYSGSLTRSLSAFSLALSLLGCNEGDRDGASGSGVGGSSGAAGAAAGRSGAGGSGGGIVECNLVPTDAPAYPVLYDAGPAPAGKGGTLVDGTYLATSETWYETPPGGDITLDGVRIVLSGSLWQEAAGRPFDVHAYRRFTHEVSTSGTALTITQRCPEELEPETFEFTAEGNTLIVYVGDGSVTFGTTFTRQ